MPFLASIEDHDKVPQMCCLYDFMNRFVEGLGLTPVPDQFGMEGRMIKEGGYAGIDIKSGIDIK